MLVGSLPFPFECHLGDSLAMDPRAQMPVQISARVLYNYVAQDSKQLSLTAGQSLIIVHDGGPGGWSRGIDTAGRTGFFPSDYAQKIAPTVLPLAHSGMAMAYQGQMPSMTVQPMGGIGMVAQPILTSNGTGFQAMGMMQAGPAGRSGGGIQSVVSSLSQDTAHGSVPPASAVALYDFSASKPTEQGFRKGERLLVVSRGAPGGWSKGERGIFPTDYVKFVDSAPASTSTAAVTSVNTSATMSSFPVAAVTSPSPMVAAKNEQPDDSSFGDFFSAAETTPATTLSDSTSFGFTSKDVVPSNPVPSAAPFDSSFVLTDQPKDEPKTESKIFSLVTESGPTNTRGSSSISSAFDFDDVDEPPIEPLVAVPSGPLFTQSSQSTSSELFSFGHEEVIHEVVIENRNKPVEPSAMVDSDFFSFSDPPVQPSPSAAAKSTQSPMMSFLDEPFAPAPSVTSTAQPSAFASQSIGQANSSFIPHFEASNLASNASNSNGGGSLLDLTDFYTPAPASSGRSGGTGSLARGNQHEDLPHTENTSAPKVFVGSLHSRIGRGGGADTVLKNRDRPAFSLNEDGDEEKEGIWCQPFFQDLFTSALIRRTEVKLDIPPLRRMANAFHSVRLAISQVKSLARRDNEISEVLSLVGSSFKEASDLCKEIPIDTNDAQKFTDFLTSFMSRIKHLRQGEIVISPCVWSSSSSVVVSQKEDDGSVTKRCVHNYHGVIILVYRTHEGTFEDFSLTVVNTSKENGGLDYHAVDVDNADGSILYNLAFELVSVPNTRIQNTAFW